MTTQRESELRALASLDPGLARAETLAVEGIRSAAVAGYFYPGESNSLAAEVRRYLEQAESEASAEPLLPKALIVPHAGYRYSGPVAASAYRLLSGLRDRIERVVLLGPSHRVALAGLGASSASSFETPLGRIPLDRGAIDRALRFPQVQIDDDAHADEHSLEVQLPFLQCLLGTFELVPFSVGDASDEEVAEVLEALWGGEETLIVISSDLSHFLDYAEATRRDARTARAIERLAPDELDWESGCGRIPTRGLLRVARHRGLEVHTLDLRNSGDTEGTRDRVVGYGAWAFCEPPAAAGRIEVDDEEREVLLDVAHRSIEHGVANGAPLSVSPDDYPPHLRKVAACFVSLHRNGELRGCIGSIEASRPLVVDVAQRAFAAAFHDSRFPPVQANEVASLEIEISILSPLSRLQVSNEAELLAQLEPGRDGLLIEDGPARGVFLPTVWKSLPQPAAFVAHLKKKAGLPEDHWSNSLACWTFATTSFSRPARSDGALNR